MNTGSCPRQTYFVTYHSTQYKYTKNIEIYIKKHILTRKKEHINEYTFPKFAFLQAEWWRNLVGKASKLLLIGTTSSEGTGRPAIKYLYIRAWCSSSCHCTDVNGGLNPSTATVTAADDDPLISLYKTWYIKMVLYLFMYVTVMCA